MHREWQQVKALEGFSEWCFERGDFLAAAEFDQTYHTWHVFRRLADGSLEALNGTWSQWPLNVPTALGWASQQINNRTISPRIDAEYRP